MAVPKTWCGSGWREGESGAGWIVSYPYAETRIRSRPDAQVHRQPAAGDQQGRHVQRTPEGRHVAGLSPVPAPDRLGVGALLRGLVSGLPGGEYAFRTGLL